MLIHYLPRDSALITALNNGQLVWGGVEHLLADLWALLARVHSDPDKVSDSLDHPIRAEMAAKAKAAEKKKLKAEFLARKLRLQSSANNPVEVMN